MYTSFYFIFNSYIEEGKFKNKFIGSFYMVYALIF